MRKFCVFLTLVLATVVPASAQANGSLDPTFGVGGRVLVPAPAPFPPAGADANAKLWQASAPGGKLVALGGGELMQFLADGSPDPGFGGDGTVTVTVDPDRSFSPSGVAVDSQGRILVAGTSTSQHETVNPGPDGSSGPTPSRATLIRYLADGSLDPSFGQGGIVTTSLGIEPPEIASSSSPPQRYESAVVTVAALTVTAGDQPVLVGSYVPMSTSGCSTQAGYAARLDTAGNIDRGFGDEGVFYDPQIRLPEVLDQGNDGQLFYSGLTSPKPNGCLAPGPQSIAGNFADLLPGGQLNVGFGTGGERPHDQSQVIAIAIDSRDRLVSLEQNYSSSYPESEGKLRVRRLLPSGAPDPAFGRNGSVWPKAVIGIGQPVGLQAIAIDGRNRVLLAGGGKTTKGTYGLQLMRLGTRGKLDLGFGRKGRIKTGFGSTAGVKASVVSLDRDGKAILGGTISGSPKLPHGEGFAFARYRMGR
jgi:uncharacterized delta-60 repeat protein